MRVLWQGSSEKRWRLGEQICHRRKGIGDMFEQQLDFIWQQGDDIRQIGRPSHYAMVSLNGTQEEVTRLGPLLVDFLNANRTADEKPRAEGQRSDAKPNNNGQVDRL